MNFGTGKHSMSAWNDRKWKVAQGEGLFSHVDSSKWPPPPPATAIRLPSLSATAEAPPPAHTPRQFATSSPLQAPG
jgi:hypothetical protein